MRVVVDTNIVVSALLFGASVPGRAFVRVLDRGTILTSMSFLEARALARERRFVAGTSRRS